MPGDGWDSQEYDFYIQQQHGELEDSVDIRWRGAWAGWHQKRNRSRRLLVNLVVYVSHVATDPSVTMTAGYTLAKDMTPINRLFGVSGPFEVATSNRPCTCMELRKTNFTHFIKMSFGLDKCAVLEIRRGRKVASRGIYLLTTSTLERLRNRVTDTSAFYSWTRLQISR